MDSTLALLAFIPLSVIGVWRWSYWLIRIIGASLYRPRATEWPKGIPKPTVSVVTPVYNEDEALFKKALNSWIANGVDEIVAVIDKTNTHLIAEYEKHYVRTKSKTKCRLVVTAKPGKRAALCDGIARAKGQLIALVDSDTYWDENVNRLVLPCFLDRSVGGVTVPQRIDNPNTTSNVLFDMLLWNRYREEVPFLLALGTVFNTLSGRTAYYRRDALMNKYHDNVHDLRHEFFFGTRGISGDDKRLTHLLIEQGWNVGYAKGATVYTEGLNDFKPFMKQRLRWTRNSWRADLRAAKRGWIWRHPALAYFMLDRFIQPFLMLIGPTAFFISLFLQEWLIAAALVIWWFVSRFIKLFGYFRAYPKRIVYLPAYILYTYSNALLKIYALGTIVEHSWATRWNSARNRKKILRRYFTVGIGVAATAAVLLVTANFVQSVGRKAAVTIDKPSPVSASEFIVPSVIEQNVVAEPVKPAATFAPQQLESYVVQEGDTLSSISEKTCMDVNTLRRINGILRPKNLTIGSTINYYCQTPSATGVTREQ